MKLTAKICGYWVIALTLGCGGCQVNTNPTENKMKETGKSEHEFTNALIHESSPYLLQHAHNPVNWYPWNDETLQKAKDENKMLLISIGYAACHWCHVMEEESFEDTAVARIMNENFICIKVDREERPDIDQIYMSAVQLLSGRGGWPLNCFALPDGRPFYGGTYFPKKQWVKLMEGLLDVYKNESSKIFENAEKLTSAVQQSDLIQRIEDQGKLRIEVLETAVLEWKKSWDMIEGGPNRAPKFPLPNNFQFLLRYGYLHNDPSSIDYVKLTLQKMAYGGIYDQIGGGFARYSTDERWKVPHFEKMLYDNAQLISLYSEAHAYHPHQLYKKTVEQTLNFVERELTSKEGAFYSSLDADSEGEEGKYYVWSKEELLEILGADYNIFSTYYALDSRGFWENGNYILMRNELSSKDFEKLNLSEEEVEAKIQSLNHQLLIERMKRPAPALDDKTLTSWNAMMAKAYLDAYAEFGRQDYLEKGRKNLSFLLGKMKRKDGGLYHNYKAGKPSINAYLEDYCFMMEALISLYELTFEENWLEEADQLMHYCIKHFFDETSGMFFFTSAQDPALIARKKELNDNVIPASNSSMAKSLFLLGNYYYKKDYLQKADAMIKNMYQRIPNYASGYSNWAMLALNRIFPFYEIAISGKESLRLSGELRKHYIPNKIVIGSKSESDLPLLENKYQEGETFIYVCVEKACQLPVQSVDEALLQISRP